MQPDQSPKMVRALIEIRETGNCIGPTATKALRAKLAVWDRDQLRFVLTPAGRATVAAQDASTPHQGTAR
jgi:hypothetical protein